MFSACEVASRIDPQRLSRGLRRRRCYNHFRSRKGAMGKALGVVILFVLGSPVLAGAGPRTVLVFPMESLSERTDVNWIAEGAAELLSERLTGPYCVALSKEERHTAYDQLGIPRGTPLTLASSYKVAEILGAEWVIVGDFNVDQDELRARVQLLDLRHMRLSPPLEAAGALTDLVDLYTRLAWRVLATSHPDFTVGKEEEFRKQFPELRLDAFESYIRGVLAHDPETKIRFFREADRRDPSDQRAAFELGRYYFEEKDYAHSAAWLRKVSEKNPNYPEAVFLLAVNDFFLGREAEAEKGFAKLTPRYPLGEVWNNCGVMKLRRGLYAGALFDFEQAYRNNPSDADFAFNMAAALWNLKRYPDAEKYLQEVLGVNMEDEEAHGLLAAVYEKLGNAEARARELEWLEDNEANTHREQERNWVKPQARIKKSFDGRGFRLLSLAIRNAAEQKERN